MMTMNLGCFVRLVSQIKLHQTCKTAILSLKLCDFHCMHQHCDVSIQSRRTPTKSSTMADQHQLCAIVTLLVAAAASTASSHSVVMAREQSR
jgi:hypothetical protein